MPNNSRYGNYEYKSSGTNQQGDHHCQRDYGAKASNPNSWHSSYRDGGYAYSNPDGSSYYKGPNGTSVYTSPKGQVYAKSADQNASASAKKKSY